MHPRTRAKYGAISKLILKLIAAGVATTLTGLSYDPTKTNRTLGGLADYGEDQIRRCLIYLRMQGYVKYSAEDTKAPLIITKKGLGRLNAQTMKEKILNFFRDVVKEMEKVTWPSREELTESTKIVIIVTLVIAVFAWVVDTALSEVLKRIL